MANDDDSVAQAVEALRIKTQPSEEELQSAPILDSWAFLSRSGDGANIAAAGIVVGSATFQNGSEIFTSTLRAVDGRRDSQPAWIQTQNTLYRLGWWHDASPLALQVALAPTWGAAFVLAGAITGEHTLPLTVLSAYATARADTMETNSTGKAPNWSLRHSAAAKIANALAEAGREAAAGAWRLLATDARQDAAAGVVSARLETASVSVERTPEIKAILAGWKLLSRGLSLGEDLSDPIAAAHRIGDRHTRNDGMFPERPSPRGVVVLRAIGGTTKSSSGKDVIREFKAIVGESLPLTLAPDLAITRAQLQDEFPHLHAQIDVLLSGLVEDEPVRLPPTLLVGEPGGGKSRLARRLAEALNVQIHRFDGSGSSDSTFAGTPRRWSSGEHCVPLEAVRRHRIANPILLVDEIDKAGHSHNNGALTSALLPFLEPETARVYPEPYVQSDVDLSHVSYILMCNDETTLPGPLRDRLKIIRLPRPTIEHLPALARGIVADIARGRSGDPRWWPDLDDIELAIAEALWRGGSVRRLRTIVERLLAHREQKPRN